MHGGAAYPPISVFGYGFCIFAIQRHTPNVINATLVTDKVDIIIK